MIQIQLFYTLLSTVCLSEVLLYDGKKGRCFDFSISWRTQHSISWLVFEKKSVEAEKETQIKSLIDQSNNRD